MRVSADGLCQPGNHWTASAYLSMLMTASWHPILAGTVWFYSCISVWTASNIRTRYWLWYRDILWSRKSFGETVNPKVKQLFQNQPRIAAVWFCKINLLQHNSVHKGRLALNTCNCRHENSLDGVLAHRTWLLSYQVIAAVDDLQGCNSSPAGLRCKSGRSSACVSDTT